MKELIVTLATLILLSGLCLAQTRVSGNVEGEWDEEGTPYIVEGNLVVPDNAELVIGPGVEVLFDGAYTFTVDGILNASGQPDAMILFSRNDEDITWRGFRILNNQNRIVFDYCIFEFSHQVGAYNNPDSRGGAIYGDDAHITVSNCEFRDNSASGQGGAATFYSCEGEFTHNHVHDNYGFTEIVWFRDSEMPIRNNLVENNRGDHGAGVIMYGSSAPVENNVFRGNNSTVMAWGGSLYFVSSSRSRVYNNLIYDNIGGGLYVGSNSILGVFDHNVIFNNRGTCNIYVYTGSSIDITNCIIWEQGDQFIFNNGSATASFSCIQNFDQYQQIEDREGVIDEDPLFVDPDEGDFHLDRESPCIDAGDPDMELDPDGSRADMGLVFAADLILDAQPDSIDFEYISINSDIAIPLEITCPIHREDIDEFELEFEVDSDPVWLEIVADENQMNVDDTLIVNIRFAPDEDLELGENNASILIIPTEFPGYAITIPVTAFVVEGFGSVGGRVYDAGDDSPIPEVTVSFDGLAFDAVTDENGLFQLDTVPAWQYIARIEHPDYLPWQSDTFAVEPDDVVGLVIPLRYAACEVTPDTILVEIAPDSLSDRHIAISNTGTGNLEYTARLVFPFGEEFEPWTRVDTIPAEELTMDSRLQGVECDGDHILVSGGNNGAGMGLIYQFSKTGDLQNAFEQFAESDWGMRDMAWDGQLVWGATDELIFGFTPEGQLEAMFRGPLELNRGLTWDPERELLWTCDTESDLIGMNYEGQVISRIPRPNDVEPYGLATYEQDPDGFVLYVFNRGVNIPAQVHKVNPETGEWRFVAQLSEDDDLRAGGACITSRLQSTATVFIGLLQAQGDAMDQLGVWLMAARTDWVGLDGEAGSVEADSRGGLNLSFDAGGFSIDDEVTASVVIEHNGRGGTIEIPLTLSVVHPDEVGNWIDPLHPAAFALTGVYPNPFNQSLNVEFSLNQAGRVDLGLFDLSGRLAATVAQGEWAVGSHLVSYEGAELPSGLYILRLASDRGVRMQKVTLLR